MNPFPIIKASTHAPKFNGEPNNPKSNPPNISVAKTLTEGPMIPGVEQVITLRVLGVVLQSNLTTGAHVDHILARCASSTPTLS